MTAGQYPRRTSGNFIVNRQATQVIMARSCLPSRYATKIILQGTVDDSRRTGRQQKSWKDNIKEWTGQSLSLLLRIADDRSRWAIIAAQTSVGVPNGAWASRELVRFLSLDEAIASSAVFVIVSGSDGRKRFWSHLNNSKTVRYIIYVSIGS